MFTGGTIWVWTHGRVEEIGLAGIVSRGFWRGQGT